MSARLLGHLFNRRLYRKETLAVPAADLRDRRLPPQPVDVHLEEAAQWILRAQAATPDDGVSGGYFLEDGWLASYPETTGYIIPSLFAVADRLNRDTYEKAALAMAEWELTVQRAAGGFPGHFVDREHPPIVFNTGQVIFGLLAAWERVHDARYADAAIRAARWLASVQDADGAWRRFDYRDTVHVYNTRTAWALVELGEALGDHAIVKAGLRNLDWAVAQQDERGWFRHCAFGPGEDPFLHTIAYTTQGLLEAGRRLQRDEYVDAAAKTCAAVLDAMRSDGWIAGTFDARWSPSAGYSCLTGNAQIAAQWFRLYDLRRDARFLDGGRSAVSFLKTLHDCATNNPNIRGAVKGSHPIWGRYSFAGYPNWAAKFLVDALLMEAAASEGDTSCIRCW